MARDNLKNVETSPVQWEVRKVEGPDGEEQERPVPVEPHIGSTVAGHEVEQTVQTGYVRGGTSRPPEDSDQEPGQVQQLDNDGNPVDVHPGEIARVQREEGSQAAADKLGGS